ncbi:MAG: hypothetical protein J6Y13_02410 [Treponema sp.]|nr:hypothetical protein [Treponema sp.]
MKRTLIGLKNGLKQTLKALVPALLLFLAVSPCDAIGLKSKEIPPDASDKEIIQMAQKAFNNSNFKLATQYYTVLLQRYGDNPVDYVIGTFEIAHIAVRKKDYKTAVPMLNEILNIYEDTPAGAIPPAYRVLAQNDLKRVPDNTRRSITANGKNNDYYENDDYGDTDFFGTPDYGASDDTEDDDYYNNSNGDYSGFRWY